MISSQKLNAFNYLKNEFNQLKNEPIQPLGCTVSLVNNDFFHWKFTLSGPQDTPYSGGKFFLTADFSQNYPNSKPEVRFVNKIYHLNVSPNNGHVSISILNNWKPKTSMVDVISAIFFLFYSQNPLSPYSFEMAREYEMNRLAFDRKAREWTKKYAS